MVAASKLALSAVAPMPCLRVRLLVGLLALGQARAAFLQNLFGSGSKEPASDPALARYFRQDSWSGLNASQRGNLFMEAAPKLGIRCPKVGLGYFYYPSLQTELRGAVATANIARGEEVCFVPLQQLLCEFSVGNSSMLGLMRNYMQRSTTAKTSFLAPPVTMKAIIALFVIREGAPPCGLLERTATHLSTWRRPPPAAASPRHHPGTNAERASDASVARPPRQERVRPRAGCLSSKARSTDTTPNRSPSTGHEATRGSPS